VSEDLKWENQCIAVVKKASKILGMMKRNFADRSEETVMALYQSLVRPHLEYCTQVWRPYLIKDIKLLEGVQRRATKLVHGIADLKYDDRLKRLGVVRLVNRRLRSDLIETSVLFCSLAILDPRVGHTMDVLSPFIPVLCHSD